MMGIKPYFRSLDSEVSVLPLAIFRIAFGVLMLVSQIRFILKGWIDELYLEPSYHFTYPGFQWVVPLPEEWMYALVIFCALCALCVALGLFYRLSIILLFLSFTYLELIDKSFYLNHYYFISLAAFLLIWLPANGKLALDNIFLKKSKKRQVTKWLVETIKWQIAITYVFAGLSKLQYDWLILAQPLDIWLSARTNLPIIGQFFGFDWMPYVFSWVGMLYDLMVPFLLMTRRTRPYAFVLVVCFHLMTWMLFNIGMFPFIMIFSALIFFDEKDWRKLFGQKRFDETDCTERKIKHKNRPLVFLMSVYFCFQVLMPLRHHLYSGNLLWNEQGFRFSWHVMVAEKNGYCEYLIRDKFTGRQWLEYPTKYLSRQQEKQMSFQPDMIWQFAKYLEKRYQLDGQDNVEIRVNSMVSLNGRKSRPLIDPEIDLTSIESEFKMSKSIVNY